MRSRTRLRVLLVEDDPVASQAVQALLRAPARRNDEGCVSVTAAATLAEALRILPHEDVNAVLLDLMLPDSEGLATLRRIVEAAPGVAIVVMTGLDDESVALEALRAGAQDYLIKGEVTRNGLMRALRHAAERAAAMPQAGPPPSAVETLRLEPGAVIASRYELLEPIGNGTGTVAFRARDRLLERLCVLKTVLAGGAAAEDFLREARSAAAIDHPRVVRVHDVGAQAGVPFLVMELIEGPTLAQRIAEGPLPPHDAARVATELLEGLAAMHARGVLHRDIKPQNVILGPAGARLIDFGLALPIKEPTLSGLRPNAPGEGSLGYLSPEALEGLPLAITSDIYSLGAVLYEMLAGRSYLPRHGRRAQIERAILEEPPPPLDAGPLGAVALRALEKDPARRYASAQEMREAILALAPA